MRRLLTTFLFALVISGSSAKVADSPYVGTWKVTVLTNGREFTLWLVKIEDKDGKAQAKVLSAGLPTYKDAIVEGVRADARGLHFTVKSGGNTILVDAYAPKEEKASKKLLGSISIQDHRDFIQIEPTDLKELDPKKAVTTSKEYTDWQKANQATNLNDKEVGLKNILAKAADQPYLAYQSGLGLIVLLAYKGMEGESDLRSTAQEIVKIGERFGPEMKWVAIQQVASQLTGAEKIPSLGLDYARQADKQMDPATPLAQQMSVLKVLVSALTKAGKKEEADAVLGRIAKLDDAMDKDFLKNGVPFKPQPFAGRKGKSDRRVVVELFTGAQCPPCVSSDIAFDALLQSYQPSDLILLQYHLHIPGPDPLTNDDAEKRAKYYKALSTPTLFVNGVKGPAMGGSKSQGQERFNTLRTALAKPLEEEAQATLKAAVDRKGSKLVIRAEVAGLKAKVEDPRLRLVLVEDVVHYPGRNGQRYHHHVVRTFPGGVEGLAVKEGAAKQEVEIDLADLTKTLTAYLTQADQKRKFLDEKRPLDLSHLKVMAFVQDDKSKEIFQAVQVDVPEELKR